jgi:arylsulfatase A-like enzyme
LEYFGFGEYEFGSHKIIEPVKRGISGTHRMQGIFIAYGANARPGVTVQAAQLVDLAPTIMHLMGLPVPAHMDGRVLDEIFPAGFRPVSIAGGQTQWQAPAGSLSEQEREILAERMRNLGYVG